MAKAYLLVSALTLIVALVHGQEAFLEQEIKVKTDKLFEVSEDLGTATSREECIQKKKCKNQGGTCQTKGEACPGEIVKGCAKGCSCCLPEEITCKRSKKCKKANGTCVNKGECNGKIIAKGCRKPKSCKKTHVCCVEDESTCRSGSDCLNTGTCPNSAFVQKHVCSHCENSTDALVFVKKGKPPTKGNVRDVFTGLLKYDKISNGKRCLVTHPTEVLSWKCIPTENGKKFDRCVDIGYCTSIQSLLSNGHFEYQYKICYHVHFGAIWVDDDKCTTLETLVIDPDTAGNCMKKCTNKDGCTAFNYKFGAFCVLMKCSTPYPTPTPNLDGYDAYYL